MEKFLTQEGLNVISVLLVLGAIGYLFVGWFVGKIRENDEAAAKAEALDNPPRYHVEVGHAAKLLARMECLHRPLPQHRNLTVPDESLDEVLARMGVSAIDRADTMAGTKLP